MILRSLLVSAAVLGAALPLQAQSLSRALGVSDIEMLLHMESPDLVAELVRDECVTFGLDAAATSRLRAARADDDLLAVIRTACFAGAELVVESEPAGAEVLVGNQRVGTTPWTGRYSIGGQMRVEVKRQGRAHSTTASLQPGQRTRARFAFAADTVKVPGVRSVADVARERNLEGQWRPTVADPGRPGPYPSSIGDFDAFFWTAFAAGTYGGFTVCKDNVECGDGAVAGLVGIGAGAVVSYATVKLISWPINAARQGQHARKTQAHAEWKRSMAAAKQNWIESHPDVLSAIAQDRAKRATAQDHNARVRARNAARTPVQVTTEMLPGRVNP